MACAKGPSSDSDDDDGFENDFQTAPESHVSSILQHTDASVSSEKGNKAQMKKSRSFGTIRRRKNQDKPTKEMKEGKKSSWSLKLKKKLPLKFKKKSDEPIPETNSNIDHGLCVCTGYRRTDDPIEVPGVFFARQNGPMTLRGTPLHRQVDAALLSQVVVHPRFFFSDPNFIINHPSTPRLHIDFPTEDIDDILIAQRALDIEQGIEVSPSHIGYTPRSHCLVAAAASSASLPGCQHHQSTQPEQFWQLRSAMQNQCMISNNTPYRESITESVSSSDYGGVLPTRYPGRTIHTQVDYMHCLVPDLLKITNCSFYWGVMDRFEAERLLDNKPEGTFLLRDSAQEEFLFSVSFRRYGRSLHARIEQWNHKFSFDHHDPGVFAADTVCGLIEHYKDPSCCMFFEPMLTLPLHRNSVFSLQHLCRAVITTKTTYDGVNSLPLPKSLQQHLKYYHYKQKVRVRQLELST